MYPLLFTKYLDFSRSVQSCREEREEGREEGRRWRQFLSASRLSDSLTTSCHDTLWKPERSVSLLHPELGETNMGRVTGVRTIDERLNAKTVPPCEDYLTAVGH